MYIECVVIEERGVGRVEKKKATARNVMGRIADYLRRMAMAR